MNLTFSRILLPCLLSQVCNCAQRRSGFGDTTGARAERVLEHP
jgi:hypothetical protein